MILICKNKIKQEILKNCVSIKIEFAKLLKEVKLVIFAATKGVGVRRGYRR